MLLARLASVATVASVLAVAMIGCGSARHASQDRDRQAVAQAKKAPSFAPFASIFPRTPKSSACAVHAGAPGNVFHGRCSTAVTTLNGHTTVTFTQDFGTYGRHVWRIAVPSLGEAHVMSQSGGGLVQLMP